MAAAGNGWGVFRMETCLHSSRAYLCACPSPALQQAQQGQGGVEGGRDEMRTGGGLSFSEERSSPCRSGGGGEAQPIGR